MGVKLAFQLKNLSGLINPKVLAYRKKNGLTHKEYIDLVKRDFEIVAEMPMDEILDLSPEEFNEIVRRIDRESFRLEIAQDGYGYYGYKNLHLSKFLDNEGNIDHNKVKQKYESYDLWNDYKKLIVYRDASGVKYTRDELDLEQTLDYLNIYFPGVDTIFVDENRNHIVMDFVDIEVRHLDMTKSLFCQPGQHWEKIGDNEECRYIKEGLDKMAELDGYDLDDPVEFYIWTYFCTTGRNYVRAMGSIAVGSQHYLNYLLDTIENKEVVELLKNYTITSNIIKVNPIVENYSFDNATSFCVKYQEKHERRKEIIYSYKYKDEEEEPLGPLGYNVVFYDFKKLEYVRE